jgi:hypothetical protein
MELDFYWNGSFLGHTHHMTVDGVEVNLGLAPFSNCREDAVKKIREILREQYNIDYGDEIVFRWGGRI